MMKRWFASSITTAVLLHAAGAGGADARVFVTARDLIASNHRIEVPAGTQVVWNDPHVDRVWSPPAAGIRVQRTDAGLSALFPVPGRYEGRLTLAGTTGVGAADVMPLTVIVTERAR